MRKILTIIICFAMVGGSSLSLQTKAAAGEYDYIALHKDYESEECLGFSDSSGKGRLGIVEDAEHGKVAKTLGTSGNDYTILSSSTNTNSVNEAHWKIELSLCVGERTGLSLRLTDRDKTAFPELFELNSTGVTASNGAKKSVSGWNDYVIILDTNEDIYSLYVNGEPFVEKAHLSRHGTDMTIENFSCIHFYVSGTGHNFSWDDVTIASHMPVSILGQEDILIEYLDTTAYVSCEAKEADEEAVLIVATYDGSKLLTCSVVSGYQYHPDDWVRFNTSVTVNEGEILKAFIWDGMTLLTPLMKSKQLYNPTLEDFRELRERYHLMSFGSSETTDLTDPVVQKKLQSINKYCKDIWSTMKKGDDIEYLWKEWKFTGSEDVYRTYTRINHMAKAWATYGSDYYHNEDLKNDIIYAMEWMYANKNGVAEVEGTGWRSIYDYDWWHWMVGAPEYMMYIFNAMGDVFTVEDIDRYLVVFDHLLETSRLGLERDYIETRAQNQFLAGMFRNDYKAMRDISNCYKLLYEFRNEGTGLYSDYSYLAHANHPYTGMYGMPTRLITVLSLINGTKFELDDTYMERMTEYFSKGLQPLMHEGKFMSLVCGRAPQDGAAWGVEAIKNAINLLNYADEKEAKLLRSFIRAQITPENEDRLLTSVSLGSLSILRDIIANESEVKLPLNTSFYNMDRMVTQRENYAFGIAMSSERISTYESVDQCNKDGWYTGDGMLYLYKSGEDHYNSDYWNYADPYKRPGTTEDTQEMLKESMAGGYFPDCDFAGSVSLGACGVAAMEFEAFHNETPPADTDYSGYGGSFPLHTSTLTAKKAWFMFDDEAVCLGTDIDANDGYEVITTIENRMKTDDSQIAVAGGTDFTASEQTQRITWAHISNCAGYYFPNGSDITFQETANKKVFYEMYQSHGISPKHQKYAYVILPDLSAGETQAYALNPDIVILNNDSHIQAVSEKTTGMTGIVFRKSGVCGNISVDSPLIAMIQETETEVKIVFCDPTQKLTSVNLTVTGRFGRYYGDETISCTISKDYAELNADISKDLGAGHEITLVKK